jgi:hypothetical protein
VLVDGSGLSGLSGRSGLSGEMADRYLRKSVSICGSFVVRVSFELVNGFFDAAGTRFWGLGAFDRYGDRLFFAVG